MDKLEQIRAIVNVWLSHPSDNPVDGACDALSAIVDILDAPGMVPVNTREGMATRDDAIDAMHDDPELNAVADLRTIADAAAQDRVGLSSEHVLKVIELCDEYIGLRSLCPRGAVVVVSNGDSVLLDSDGEPTTLFDAVYGACDFAGIVVDVSEVPGDWSYTANGGERDERLRTTD
jgi:hypothetical protein